MTSPPAQITREDLHAYLTEAIGDVESARIEKALRSSAELRAQLEEVRRSVGPSEHSIGSIWREERLTCPDRDKLGGFLMNTLEPNYRDYVEFHLKTVECPFCLANLEDLSTAETANPEEANKRRRRIFDAVRGRMERREP